MLKSKKLCLHHLDIPLVIPKSSKTKCFHKKCGFAAKYTLRDFSIISPLKNFQFWPNFFKHLHFFQVFKNLQFRPKFEKLQFLPNFQISSTPNFEKSSKFYEMFKFLQFCPKFE